MTINHLNLVVPDVDATANFFVKYFDFELQPTAVKYLAILHGGGDFVLVISNFPNTPSYDYPKDFHIGFYQPDHQAVDRLYDKLKEGITMDVAPRNIRDRYGFYFYAPGKVFIEITCPQHDIPHS